MKEIWTAIDGSKTYIALGLGLAVCAAELAGIDVVKDITKDNALTTGYGLIVAAFMRHGVGKVVPK